MLTKQYSKILNVKHTAIDDLFFNPDSSLSVRFIQPKDSNVAVASVEGSLRCMTTVDVFEDGAPAIGIPISYILKHSRLAPAVLNIVLSPHLSHGQDTTAGYMTCNKLHKKGCLRTYANIWHTVGPIISRVKKELEPTAHHFEGLENIGIDGTSHRKGHKYLTVIIECDKGKVIWA